MEFIIKNVLHNKFIVQYYATVLLKIPPRGVSLEIYRFLSEKQYLIALVVVYVTYGLFSSQERVLIQLLTFYLTECMFIIFLLSLEPHNLPSVYEIVKPLVIDEQGRIKRDFSTKENKVP